MSRYFSYLNTAIYLLTTYNGKEPFHIYASKFFAENKKYGSQDRKHLKHLCYSYFRAARFLTGNDIGEKIKYTFFLCCTTPQPFLAVLDGALNEVIENDLAYKKRFLQIHYPQLISDENSELNNYLSQGITENYFTDHLLQQPDVFIRIRPSHYSTVLNKLQKETINFTEINSTCFSVPAGVDITRILQLDKEAVIQDYSSQQVGIFMQRAVTLLLPQTAQINAWDCCAASGGKSIMLYDIYPQVKITVSDIRLGILHNLKLRFKQAGIIDYSLHCIDLCKQEMVAKAKPKSFNLIIADVPCTGSGTWSRTPEQFYFFNTVKINEYAAMQRKIVDNLIPEMNDETYLLYITCSVFKTENEDQVKYFVEKYGLVIVDETILSNHINFNSDTLFAALLKKVKNTTNRG